MGYFCHGKTMADLAGLARKRILQWMAANPHITQAQIGRELGLTQAWVSKYKLGTQEADIDQLAIIARCYGHTLIELFDLRPDPKERALLDAFRALTPEKRDLAIRMLEAMVPPIRGMALETPRGRHTERR
jgi:transcriptional regulator with XRE-family HTH domain